MPVSASSLASGINRVLEYSWFWQLCWFPCSNISFPGRAPEPGVVHKQGCVPGIKQKVCPLLPFLTMACFDSVTLCSDRDSAAACVGSTIITTALLTCAPFVIYFLLEPWQWQSVPHHPPENEVLLIRTEACIVLRADVPLKQTLCLAVSPGSL